MTVLLDTDVLIDCLRATPAARDWLKQHAGESFQVPGVVAMELLMGCRDRSEVARVQAFLDRFSIVWPEAAEFAQAYDLLAQYRLASALSIPDCLIAAMALARTAQVYTFNLKHYRVIAGIQIQAPYARA